jgi:hypothetical protein
MNDQMKLQMIQNIEIAKRHMKESEDFAHKGDFKNAWATALGALVVTCEDLEKQIQLIK